MEQIKNNIKKITKMASLKLFYGFMDVLFFSIWGLTIMDVLKLINVGTYSDIDNIIKTLMALAGLIYFAFSIPHKLKMQRLERKMKEEEIEKLERENDKEKDK